MIETENQSDSRVSRLDQQNEDLLVAGGANEINGGDQAAAAITATVEDAGESKSMSEKEKKKYRLLSSLSSITCVIENRLYYINKCYAEKNGLIMV